jgi:hypothetical protein
MVGGFGGMLGIPRQPDLFGWDNEFEVHVVDVPLGRAESE